MKYKDKQKISTLPKFFENKIGKFMAVPILIIISLVFVLATSVYYEGNLSGYVVKKFIISNDEFFSDEIQIKSVNNINDLSQLNEGWYEIINGHVFYLDTFDYYIPLYIKIKDKDYQNVLLVVDSDGTIEIKKIQPKVKFFSDENQESTQNRITGKAIGMERVSGFVASATQTQTDITQTSSQERKIPENDINRGNEPKEITIDGEKKITLKPGQAYDRKTGNILIILEKEEAPTTSPTVPSRPGEPKIIRGILREDNVPVYVYPVDKKTGLQTISIGSQEHKIQPKLLENVDYDKWDGKSIESMPIAGGTRKITIDDKGQKAIDIDTSNHKIQEITITESTTTIEKFKTAYFYKGKEITEEEYEKLSDKEKAESIKFEGVSTYKVTEETKDGTKFVTTYQYTPLFDSKTNNLIVDYEATKIDQKTGELDIFIYGRITFDTEGRKVEQKIVLDKDGKPTDGYNSNHPLFPTAKFALFQYKSRQFFANVERIFTEFQGLGYYATLFFDEDSLLAWRDNVDRIFATLHLGIEYWSSSICGTYLDGEDEGIAYAETPQGLSQIGAHVEATRTEPINTLTGVEFIYKITFNVRNGDYPKDLRAPEEMNINVILKGDRTANVFRQDIKIERGSTFGRAGSNAIVQESSVFYNQVCIKFDKIPLRWKLDNNELCNTIQESKGEPTPLTTPSTTTAPAGTRESDINDF